MLHWDELKRLHVPPRVAAGYAAGLATASLAFWLVPAIWLTVVNSMAHSVAPDNSAASPVIYLLIAVLLVFSSIIVCAFAVFFTFLPFCLFYAVSVLLGIRHVLYFVLSGALTGYLIATLFHAAAPPFRDFWAIAQWPAMSVCGAIGGLVYWWIAVHHETPATALKHAPEAC